MTKFSLLLFLSIVLLSCGSIKPVAPDIVIGSMDSLPAQPVSYMSIPIKIDLTPYFDETNKSVPTKFAGSEAACEGVSVDYKFSRGAIKFEGVGKKLNFDVDGKYSLQMNYCPQCTELFSSAGNCVIPRVYASCGIGEPMRKMHVGFSTEIGITKNYKLTSKTKLRTAKALSPCKVSIFNYNATSKVEEEVGKALKEVEKDIDKEISSISLLNEIQETWDILREPIDLEGYGFLSLNPKSISMSKISYKGKYAHFNAVLKSKPNVDLIKPTISKNKVPNLSTHKKKNGFNVTLDINAPYDSLSSVLSKSISGTEMELKGKQIIFGDIAVHGAADQKLSIQVDFSGKKKGTLYLVGTPVFNADSQHISFPDLEFDIKTKSLLLKSAKWLFDKKITETIRNSANMDLKPQLDTLKHELNHALNMELDEGVYLSGEIKSVSIEAIIPTTDKLFIRGKGTGKMKLEM